MMKLKKKKLASPYKIPSLQGLYIISHRPYFSWLCHRVLWGLLYCSTERFYFRGVVVELNRPLGINPAIAPPLLT